MKRKFSKLSRSSVSVVLAVLLMLSAVVVNYGSSDKTVSSVSASAQSDILTGEAVQADETQKTVVANDKEEQKEVITESKNNESTENLASNAADESTVSPLTVSTANSTEIEEQSYTELEAANTEALENLTPEEQTAVDEINQKIKNKALPAASGASDPAVATGYKRAYFYNRQWWHSIKAHIYNSDGNVTGNWPGTTNQDRLKESLVYPDTYYVDLTSDEKVIFNTGYTQGSGQIPQSGEISYSDLQDTPTVAYYVFYRGDARKISLSNIYDDDYESDPYVIYYRNTANWSIVYFRPNGSNGAHNSTANTNPSNGGIPMAHLADTNTTINSYMNYVILRNTDPDVTSTKHRNSFEMLFYNGSWGNDNQTNNFTYTPPATGTSTNVYYYGRKNGGDGSGKYYIVYHAGNSSALYDLTDSAEVTLGIENNTLVAYADIDVSSISANTNVYFALSYSSSYTDAIYKGSTAAKINISGDTVSGGTQNSTYSNNTYQYGYFSFSDSDLSTVRINIDNFSGSSYTIDSDTYDGVVVYAKSGTIRDNYQRYSKLAEVTSIAYTDTPAKNIGSANTTYTASGTTYTSVIKALADYNRPITVTVQLRNEYIGKYFIKAFDVNGYSYNVIDQSQAPSNGTYTLNYTPTEDETKIEITPIYYYVINDADANTYNDSANFVTFYAEDFNGDVRDAWLGTISCYAYYNSTDSGYLHKDETTTIDDSAQSALGGYPGQPMVYEGGSYTMQLPRYLYNGTTKKATIEGITMNNYVWDTIHAQVNNVSSSQSANNCQTYDYDDFSALLERGATDIIYSFKYRTYNNSNSSNSSKSGDHTGEGNPWHDSTLTTEFVSTTVPANNGWDVLTDYYDYPVDIFANRLSGYTESTVASKSNTDTDKVFIVSDGYVNYYLSGEEYLGRYATRWNVYMYDSANSNYTLIGSMPPSAFLSDCVTSSSSTITASDIDDDAFLSFAGVTFINGGNKDLLKAEYVKLYNACKGKPAVITYESALYGSQGRLAASNTQSGNSDPGYRNDGRWYYSIPGETITANVKIQIVDEDGNIVTINGSDFDTFTDTHTGTKTNANAYFTNKSTDVNGNSLYETVTATVSQDKTETFTFTADAYSYNSTDEVYYEFVGWYLNTGSKVYNPLNYGTEASYTIASRSMGSNANFIARYKAVEYDVEDADASARRLIVSHDLYSKTKNTNPTPHNGDGTPYVKVEILNSSDEVIKTYNNTQGAITVNSGSSDNYLRDSYKVRVTLTTETSDSNTSLVTNGIYRKNESSYLSYADTNNKDSLGTIGTLSTTNGTSSNTYSITYTYAMSDLFGSTEYGLKTLDYFTDLYTISNITINFKYFDRNTSNHSAPITMSETPTTISISANPSKTVSGTTTKSIANAVTNALYAEQSSVVIDGETVTVNNSVMGHLANVIDSYYFWTATDLAENGLKAMDYYGDTVTETIEGVETTRYKTYSEHYGTSGIDYTCHTDAFSRPKGYTNNSYTYTTSDNSEKWVTYTTVGSTTPIVYNSTTTMTDDVLSTVDEVTVWVYNAPKEYTVKMYVPASQNGTVTETAESSGIYWNNSNVNTVKGFFNQRLGDADADDTGNTGINAACTYLTNYGITASYLGEATAPTISGKVFDGWYLYDETNETLGAKITSNSSYGYRITGNITVIAVYKNSSTATDNVPGVSVTDSGIDYYVAQSGEDGDWYVRLNTQMNVYYPQTFVESDENIKQYSAIIVKLPVVDASGNPIQWTSEKLAALEDADVYTYNDETGEQELTTDNTDLRTVIMAHLNSITDSDAVKGKASFVINIEKLILNKKGGINSFTYDIVWEGTPTSTQATLTNKNRIMFTLPMKASQYEGGTNSALMSYAAIYYYDGTNTPHWILSDNYVPFVYSDN